MAPVKEKKNVMEEVVEKLMSENRNLKIHVEALQRRLLNIQNDTSNPWVPAASSTMKFEPEDKENFP